ncbi:uncharacterized protein LOC106718464 [Papilio machaon]|uniref:uncharacterized protein LOC106718464 n=1 Tax=Papilio machaon TaxID=76193 RepID=UPI001E663E83|nr:uncharacterized protein LOC106718464 [Papilio machaon]
MALDKQKILSELGSVMNQLQSADCGCMGKLFNNRSSYSNMSNSTPGTGDYRQGCCRCPGYNRFGSSCSGEPNSNGMQNMNHCMGRCNPTKLYSDTYQYLNSNLMQPVVQEVYNDLKSITPANTIMNNPPGNPLMPSQGQTNMYNQGVGDQSRGMGGQMGGMGGHMSGKAAPTADMGSNIVNMMMGGHKPIANDTSMRGGNSLTQPMVIDAPQSPHGNVGVVPLSNQMNAYQANDPKMHAMNNQQQYTNPGHLVSLMEGASQPPMYANPQASQPSISPTHANPLLTKPNVHSQHAPGVNKFNQMFPGVMQNFGEDLGFDPMAIAVQMNPANQQRTAIDTIQKLMSGNTRGINRTSNVLNQGQVQNAAPADQTAQPTPLATPVQQNNIPTDHSSLPQLNQPVSQRPEQVNYQYGSEGRPQQVYTTLTSDPNKQMVQQPQYREPLLPQQPQYSAETPRNALQNVSGNENDYEPYGNPRDPHEGTELPPVPSSMKIQKVPIFPVDLTHTRSYSPIKRTVFSDHNPLSKAQSQSPVKRLAYSDYNTLGQPILRVSASRYIKEDPPLPQTLSPQDSPKPRIFSNVKATVSKTSIISIHRVGKNPSKSQLQHLYNQYKGSQSLTHQNAVNNNQVASYSEGKLNVPQQQGARAQPIKQVVEKVGGDTLQNTTIESNNVVAGKQEQFAGQFGDVLSIKRTTNEERLTPSPRQRKGNNGLQDQVYTSYPKSTAWSFHGHPYLPTPIGARARKRY